MTQTCHCICTCLLVSRMKNSFSDFRATSHFHECFATATAPEHSLPDLITTKKHRCDFCKDKENGAGWKRVAYNLSLVLLSHITDFGSYVALQGRGQTNEWTLLNWMHHWIKINKLPLEKSFILSFSFKLPLLPACLTQQFSRFVHSISNFTI